MPHILAIFLLLFGVPALAQIEATRWSADTLNWQSIPVDLSFMNRPEAPAGKRGFVRAVGSQLLFADGSPARFWGTNITAYALFGTPKEVVRWQAKRLSRLGFNLVRLHHHDSPWVNPNIFGDAQAVTGTQNLSAESLDKLDWWIKCLKDEGIYVWMDLHVGRAVKAGDKIDGFDEMRKGKDQGVLNGFNYVNPSIQTAMKRFNQAYVTHVNPYTGLAAKDEPAIAAMLITNENDLTHHYGNALLPDKQVPQHNRWYTAQAEQFARRWGLPKDQVWRSWEPGASKLFLNDLEHRFNVDMLAHLRGLGVKVPIATTNTWGNPLSSLPALTTGDVIDVHAYGGTGELQINPLKSANMLHWIAAAQVVGKPLTVTEWNASPFPTPDRHVLPMWVAAAASHQGWDALMQYAYTQQVPDGPGYASNWHAYNDPALLATLPAAALLYRQGHVREATSSAVFAPSADQLFNQAVSPANSVALRTAAETGRLLIALPPVKELPWLMPAALPAGSKVFSDVAKARPGSDATESISDTGELTHRWQPGTYSINTLRTQAAMGRLGGQTLLLPDLTLKISTASATVAVQSLDGAALAQSRNILISIAAQAVPQPKNQLPFLVEPVEGELQIRAPKGLKLTRYDAQQRPIAVPTRYQNGVYTLKLDSTLQTGWLFLHQ